jgi:anti-anti-sigma factor
MYDPWRDLRLFITDAGTGTWLELRGELDVAAVPALRHHLAIVSDAGMGDVDVDMAGVAFADSTTLCVLVDARQRLAVAGRRLRVVSPSRAVRRLLRVADVAQLLA